MEAWLSLDNCWIKTAPANTIKRKKEYLADNQKLFDLGIDTSDIYSPPLKLFNKKKLIHFLKKQNAHFHFSKSFNPFYHPGQPEFVDWRFDLILEKI